MLFGTAADPNPRYVLHALKTHTNIVVDEVAHHVHVELAGVALQRSHAEIHEGVGTEGAGKNARLVDVFRVGANLAQRIIDADERLVEIDIVGELQLNLGAAARCARDDAI